MATVQAAEAAAGVAPATRSTFIDSGSVNLAGGGVYVVEVWDNDAGVIVGGAFVVLGATWAAVIGSASRAGGPTFTTVGSAVQVATSGGTGHTIAVVWRRVAARGGSVVALA
jgi:hypothetical protein